MGSLLERLCSCGLTFYSPFLAFGTSLPHSKDNELVSVQQTDIFAITECCASESKYESKCIKGMKYYRGNRTRQVLGGQLLICEAWLEKPSNTTFEQELKEEGRTLGYLLEDI